MNAAVYLLIFAAITVLYGSSLAATNTSASSTGPVIATSPTGAGPVSTAGPTGAGPVATAGPTGAGPVVTAGPVNKGPAGKNDPTAAPSPPSTTQGASSIYVANVLFVLTVVMGIFGAFIIA